jgi:hypothetical protein
MRIEALAALGQHENARMLARAFLAHHPKSAYANRVRRIAGGVSSGP